MLNVLLTELPEGGKKIGVGEAAIDALLGFIVVFIGIAFLVFIVWLVGWLMRKITGRGAYKKRQETIAESREKDATSATSATSASVSAVGNDEPDEETVAVITAAIMAYYAKEKPKCEFTVKRIKRI